MAILASIFHAVVVQGFLEHIRPLRQFLTETIDLTLADASDFVDLSLPIVFIIAKGITWLEYDHEYIAPLHIVGLHERQDTGLLTKNSQLCPRAVDFFAFHNAYEDIAHYIDQHADHGCLGEED